MSCTTTTTIMVARANISARQTNVRHHYSFGTAPTLLLLLLFSRGGQNILLVAKSLNFTYLYEQCQHRQAQLGIDELADFIVLIGATYERRHEHQFQVWS